MLRIEPFHAQHLIELTRVVEDLGHHLEIDWVSWQEYLSQIGNRAGNAWVLERAHRAIGVACVDKTPGIVGAYDLNGFIARAEQRRGLGTTLLTHAIGEIRDMEARQLFHVTESINSKAFHFLISQDFYVEHTERIMALDLPATYEMAGLPEEYTVETCGKQKAITSFIRLYDLCFYGHPWYQPYDSDEVAGTLQNPADILFLLHHEDPIGFCWTRQKQPGVGEIEPIGILPHFQNRGLGEFLLKTGLNRLYASGIRHVEIGAWEDNQAATNLYRKIGFQDSVARTYLALDL